MLKRGAESGVRYRKKGQHFYFLLKEFLVTKSCPQYKPVAARRREVPPGEALAAFQARTRYGPIFGCLVCQGAFFLEEVVGVTKVPVLLTAGGQARYMARAFVWAEHLHLFTMLDTQWACTGCVAARGDGRLPALAAVNGLGAPWVALHHSLLKVSNEEVELLALNQVFTTVDGLRLGTLGRGAATKTILVPMAGVENVPTRLALPRTRREVLALHSMPPSLPPSPVLREPAAPAGEAAGDQPQVPVANPQAEGGRADIEPK